LLPIIIRCCGHGCSFVGGLLGLVGWLVGPLVATTKLPTTNYQLPTANWQLATNQQPPSSSSVVAEKHKILWIRISCEAHQSAIRPKASQEKNSNLI